VFPQEFLMFPPKGGGKGFRSVFFYSPPRVGADGVGAPTFWGGHIHQVGLVGRAAQTHPVGGGFTFGVLPLFQRFTGRRPTSHFPPHGGEGGGWVWTTQGNPNTQVYTPQRFSLLSKVRQKGGLGRVPLPTLRALYTISPPPEDR